MTAIKVTVAETLGSAPRGAGATMIVRTDGQAGSIGGGALEKRAIEVAREMLAEGTEHLELRLPLGPTLQQCCGGAVFLHFEVFAEGGTDWLVSAAGQELNNTRAVLAGRIGGEEPVPAPFLRKQESTEGDSRLRGTGRESGRKMLFTDTGATGSLGDKSLDELAAVKATTLLSSERTGGTALLHPLAETQSILPDASDALFFEVISPSDFHILLFGAGHVGRAVVDTLADATDCRITWVDSRAGQFPGNLPHNVEPRLTDDPVRDAAGLSKDAYCLVMTHSHELDQDLCEALLLRNDFAFLGLIGSATKRRRFVLRLNEKGIGDEQLERLTCPIGIPGIEAKEPGVIAISVAAQLLKILSADDADLRR